MLRISVKIVRGTVKGTIGKLAMHSPLECKNALKLKYQDLPYSAVCHARQEHKRARLLPLPVGLSSRQCCLRSRPFIICENHERTKFMPLCHKNVYLFKYYTGYFNNLGPVVRRVNSIVGRINYYSVDKSVSIQLIYPLDKIYP